MSPEIIEVEPQVKASPRETWSYRDISTRIIVFVWSHKPVLTVHAHAHAHAHDTHTHTLCARALAVSCRATVPLTASFFRRFLTCALPRRPTW
eukprot:4767750-Amphidinium_carterae.1